MKVEGGRKKRGFFVFLVAIGLVSQPAQARERKPLTLVGFNSRFGEVAVQPVIRQVNGAQFSLGF